MRTFILLFIFFLAFPLISCGSGDDYYFDVLEKTENSSELLKDFNNNPLNICSFTDGFNVIDFSIYMKQNSSGSVQGCACYGNYLFQFQDGFRNIFIYNLKTKEYIKKLEYDLQSLYHCNNANFSTKFYSNEDQFPLLYVSQQNNTVHQTLVYRLTGDSIDNINLNLVQTIIGPTPTIDNHMNCQDCIVDGDNGYLYLYAPHRCEEFESSLYIVKYKLPSLDESIKQLKDEDICGSVYYDKKNSSPQGAIYYNGLIYIVKGVPGWNENVYLDIVDFDKKEVCSINMTEKGFKKEPEGLCIFEDRLICATNGSGIYCLNLINN